MNDAATMWRYQGSVRTCRGCSLPDTARLAPPPPPTLTVAVTCATPQVLGIPFQEMHKNEMHNNPMWTADNAGGVHARTATVTSVSSLAPSEAGSEASYQSIASIDVGGGRAPAGTNNTARITTIHACMLQAGSNRTSVHEDLLSGVQYAVPLAPENRPQVPGGAVSGTDQGMQSARDYVDLNDWQSQDYVSAGAAVVQRGPGGGGGADRNPTYDTVDSGRCQPHVDRTLKASALEEVYMASGPAPPEPPPEPQVTASTIVPIERLAVYSLASQESDANFQQQRSQTHTGRADALLEQPVPLAAPPQSHPASRPHQSVTDMDALLGWQASNAIPVPGSDVPYVSTGRPEDGPVRNTDAVYSVPQRAHQSASAARAGEVIYTRGGPPDAAPAIDPLAVYSVPAPAAARQV